jgi:hypothetical protein
MPTLNADEALDVPLEVEHAASGTSDTHPIRATLAKARR